LRGLFVTGTGTGVGKTVVAAAITAALRARGVDARPFKPVLTGLDEPPDPNWPPDHELLAQAAGCSPDLVHAVAYGPPVSPHLAAELSGRPLDPKVLLAAVHELADVSAAVIVEGVGGLLVPLSESYDIRRLAHDLELPLLIAAAPTLGTINHTLLTLEAARAAGLRVLAVVLTPWPDAPGELERSNRDTIARLGKIDVLTLAPILSARPEQLAQAGATLPLDRWLGL
jgi:dethiobiotin synthetase